MCVWRAQQRWHIAGPLCRTQQPASILRTLFPSLALCVPCNPENPDPAFPSHGMRTVPCRPSPTVAACHAVVLVPIVLSPSSDRGRSPCRRPSSYPPPTVAVCHAVAHRPLVLRRPWPFAMPSPVVLSSCDRNRLPRRRPLRAVPACLLKPVIIRTVTLRESPIPVVSQPFPPRYHKHRTCPPHSTTRSLSDSIRPTPPWLVLALPP